MRKTFLAVSLAFLAGMLGTYCGGDSTESLDPAAAAATFESPTGTIDAASAEDVMNDATEMGNAEAVGGLMYGVPGLGRIVANQKALQKLKPILQEITPPTDCITAVENGATIDYGCVFEGTPELGCTGSGTVSYVVEGAKAVVSFNDLEVSCGENGEYSVDGTVTIVYDAELTAGGVPMYIIFDLTGNIDGESLTFQLAVAVSGTYVGQVAVHVADGWVIIAGAGVNAECTSAYASVRTADGDKCVNCTITTDPATGCTSIMEIVTIDTCEVVDGLCPE